jgi:acyl carrier protein
MSVEEVIRTYITREIMQGRDDRTLALDYPLIDEHVLDSMDIQRLVAFLETQFGVRVTDDFLLPDNFASVRAIARMVGELGGTA